MNKMLFETFHYILEVQFQRTRQELTYEKETV